MARRQVGRLERVLGKNISTMKLLKFRAHWLLGALLVAFLLPPFAVASGEDPGFQFDVDGDNSSILVEADLHDFGQGGATELPDDRGRARGGVVSDGPRRVWAAADDPDLGCRADKSSFAAQVVGLGCSGIGVVCSTAFPGASMSIGRDVDSSTGAPVFGTERWSGCSRPSSGGGGAVPVMPVVTESDFRSLGVEPLAAHIGPPGGWIPIGIDMIAWAESREQTFDVVMLGQAVKVRATPVKYVWDFGDGTVLTTTFPGREYPARDVSMRYAFQGWYEVSLVTQFSGEYSVNGGPWQPIAGNIEVASEKRWIYSDLRESRLVGDEVPDEYRNVPERGPDTLGPVNPNARVETLTAPHPSPIV